MLNFIKNLFPKAEVVNIEIPVVKEDPVVEEVKSTKKKVSMDEIEWAKNAFEAGPKGNLKDYHRAVYILNKYGVRKFRSKTRGAIPLSEKYRVKSMAELQEIVVSPSSTVTQRKAAVQAAFTLGFSNAKASA